MLLIDVASHTMVPFFDQGCNCGFEDTLVLSQQLDQHCCEGKTCSREKRADSPMARAINHNEGNISRLGERDDDLGCEFVLRKFGL